MSTVKSNKTDARLRTKQYKAKPLLPFAAAIYVQPKVNSGLVVVCSPSLMDSTALPEAHLRSTRDSLALPCVVMQQCRCVLHSACCMLHLAARTLHVACCMLHVACCMLQAYAARCSRMHVACCMWHVVRCMWHVVCYMLHAACCMLHTACCTLRVAHCRR